MIQICGIEGDNCVKEFPSHKRTDSTLENATAKGRVVHAIHL